MTDEQNNETTEDGEVVLAKGDTPDFKWYVIHALSGYENRVKIALKERIVNHKLVDHFSAIFVPEETVVANVNGKKRNIKKKFFPGYVLVKMIMTDKTWHLVKETEKVTGFVGGLKGKPQPITEEEAAFMTNQVAEGYKRPKTQGNFSEGDSVKVIEGPFASFVGTVENVSDKGKVKVNVSIFGRPTPVELDFSQIEKV
ncbi:MAG: transcription termination/antitermination protein NusG [Bacteriovoracaceae bacterium]|nr:transcription termination/antitermination protein NusG [Bacteriovoracaceae bacterium]